MHYLVDILVCGLLRLSITSCLVDGNQLIGLLPGPSGEPIVLKTVYKST